jgi:hypothetical protein
MSPHAGNTILYDLPRLGRKVMSSILELKDKTGRTLKELYQSVRLTDDGEGFEIPFENFYIKVNFGEYSDEEQIKWRNERGLPITYISITSYVMDTIKPSAKFYEYISVELPQKILCQHWVGVDQNNEGHVFFALYNRIAGDSADPNEIKYAILNVNWDANNAGELLKEKFAAKWIWEKD